MESVVEKATQFSYLVAIIFALGYAAIVVEQFVIFNKAASALLMAVACWILLFFESSESVERHLQIFSIQMFKTSQVIFFLLGALTIVEIINAHKGFSLITEKLSIYSKTGMLVGVSFTTFFLSSILDNLTSTIVMISLIGKVVKEHNARLKLGGIVVIAANAGGAWTPIGDVSTTLLWIYGQVSTWVLLKNLFIPSIFCLLVPIIWFLPQFRGQFEKQDIVPETIEPGGTWVLILGVCSLIFVPFFKLITGLPPFMGMMFGLGIMWVVTDLLHYKHEEREHLRVRAILPKIDVSILIFYLGVLLSINALESAGLLKNAAEWLNQKVQILLAIPFLIGLMSSIVDNVSLVAASIAMYGLSSVPADSAFWQLIAYCAGTGGSILVIGSAAGVALMAIEQVSFAWYFKTVTIPAFLGYLAGFGIFILLQKLGDVFF